VSLVLDSSATLAWLYQDEVSDSIRRIFDLISTDGAWVPSLWRLEVANGLQIGTRRRRIDASYRSAALADLSKYDIAIDQETDGFAWTTTLQLADRFGLTLYDAAYLELAQRRHLPLATLDQQLRAAAMAVGVALLGVAD
jgi:predicted nucleic acid-binding protein